MAHRHGVLARLVGTVGLIWLLVACQPPAATATRPAPRPSATAAPVIATPAPVVGTPAPEADLTPAQAATLSTLRQIADYPLYTMHYSSAYPGADSSAMAAPDRAASAQLLPQALSPGWGCSLFAALGAPDSRLYGRNFDWRFSPALLLFTNPPDGYASVSMVDIAYLGFDDERGKGLAGQPLGERRALLAAPELPFDGLNAKGLAVGMAAVPAGDMTPEPQKKTLDEVGIIRAVLDHAATAQEAVDWFGRYNLDMGSVPLHYLVADAGGHSALVEFYAGERRVIWNARPWQMATNFLVSATAEKPEGHCWRYDQLSQQLTQAEGRLDQPAAMKMLSGVAQNTTQWSIVYGMTTGDIDIAMGGDYAHPVQTLHLYMIGP